MKTIFKAGEIIAPRFWVFERDQLFGASKWRKPWPHDEPIYQPQIESIQQHGVYAFKSVDYLYGWLENAPKYKHIPVIVGTIRLWGTVYGAPNGWRGSYGRVHSLDTKVIGRTRTTNGEDLERLRKRYLP
jgi:hypothetical protein